MIQDFRKTIKFKSKFNGRNLNLNCRMEYMLKMMGIRKKVKITSSQSFVYISSSFVCA